LFATKESKMRKPAKSMGKALLSAVLCSLPFAAPLAQTAAPPTGGAAASGTATLSNADKKFVEEAAAGGMAEVELGKLAEQRATNPQVKQFGSRMVQDHGKANDELKSLASSKGVQVPAALPKSKQADVDKLGKMTGADFDKAYMKHMVDDHKHDVSMFEKQSKSGQDSDLKAWAGKTLPTLREHQQLAQTTNASVSK
jgi:putative membrane protein